MPLSKGLRTGSSKIVENNNYVLMVIIVTNVLLMEVQLHQHIAHSLGANI